MKKIMKILGLTIFAIIIVCGTSFLTDKSHYSTWKVKNNSQNNSAISWARFEWSNDTLGKKFYEKTSMSIPCKIIGLPYNFTFQFDLGTYDTEIYENNLNSFFEVQPDLANNFKRLRSSLQFWNSKKCYDNLNISFGNYVASNEKAYVHSSYGSTFKVDSQNINDTFHLGTIGADIFQDKVLIIDYPNQKFALCDSVPQKFKKNLTNIEIDKFGKIILPYKSKRGVYKITFDNGSSLFPIISRSINRTKFSINPIIDSIEISSWSEKHVVVSRLITDTFELAGKKYCNVKVYENFTDKGIDKNTDGVTGNYLFWNTIIIIDFKNKKFGVE